MGAHFPMSPVLGTVVAAHNVGYRWRAGPGPVIHQQADSRCSDSDTDQLISTDRHGDQSPEDTHPSGDKQLGRSIGDNLEEVE